MGNQEGKLKELLNCLIETFDEVANVGREVIINLNIHNNYKKIKSSK